VIPTHVRSLFWDTNADTFEPEAFPRYTIERVLEHGTEEDVAWLLRAFHRGAIADVLRTNHRLSPRSANFWALCFGLPLDEVAALQPR
jgi:hypothetical protein